MASDTTTQDPHALPAAPAGFDACRSMLNGGRAQITHLVALDESGSNGGRPTACGLTRFDDVTPDGRRIPDTAGLPGWGMGNSGVSGPGVEQEQCSACYSRAQRMMTTETEEGQR